MYKLNIKGVLAIIIIGGICSGYVSQVIMKNSLFLWPLPTLLLLVFSLSGFIFFFSNAIIIHGLIIKQPTKILIKKLLSFSLSGCAVCFIGILLLIGSSYAFESYVFLINGISGFVAAILTYFIFSRYFKIKFSIIDLSFYALFGFITIVVSSIPTFSNLQYNLIEGYPFGDKTMIIWQTTIAFCNCMLFVRKRKIIIFIIVIFPLTIFTFYSIKQPILELYSRKLWFESIKTNNIEQLLKIPNPENKCKLETNSGTSLHIASRHGSIDVIKVLLKIQMNVDVLDRHRLTPLFLAKNSDVAQILIDAGANVNFQSRNFKTPLLFHKDISIIKVLVENGANVSGICTDPSNFNRTPLINAILDNNYEIIDYLLDHGADINQRTGHNLTAICYAKNFKMLKHLINKGGKIYESMELKQFIYNKDFQSLKYLFENGVSPLVSVDVLNGTDYDLLKFLLENGAELNRKHHVGSWTALMFHSYHGHAKIVKLFMDFGANPKIKNRKNQTAIDLAKNDTIISILKGVKVFN